MIVFREGAVIGYALADDVETFWHVQSISVSAV